ncbi:MAG: nuclear transport factor 2 family protein [Pseudomonadota bacterium]|nr:nuclear transport factor 2 family protein [Pseudomonadota bacterium]
MTRHQEISGAEKGAKPRRREPAASFSRRAALTAALALPLAARAAGDESDLLTGAAAGLPVKRAPPDLVRRSQEAVRAFIRGDVAAYLGFIDVADDFTLMQPFGGEVSRGFNRNAEWAEAIADYFKDGEADVELVQSYASGEEQGDIAVLVTIEHQHGRVGGLPDQQWPLRVTLVFRRGESDWELVHRHADLTVSRITLEQAAAMARGDWAAAVVK